MMPLSLSPHFLDTDIMPRKRKAMGMCERKVTLSAKGRGTRQREGHIFVEGTWQLVGGELLGASLRTGTCRGVC